MVPLDKLEQITRRFEYLEAKLSSGAAPGEIATLSREYSDLKPVTDEIEAYKQALNDLSDAEAMLQDPEMRALAAIRSSAVRLRGANRTQYCSECVLEDVPY